ncbi:MAG: HAD-IIA family hydrolase [Clostridiales bacterium]|jgi:NagD protein|nr:HAD-IIA family hydrolase [Clostridiales bacterium]
MIDKFFDCQLILFDLDGTIYVGDKLIDGAAEAIDALRASGRKVCFLTNNSSKSKLQYLDKLNKMGLKISEYELYTSAQATYEYLGEHLAKKRVYLVSTDEIRADFEAAGTVFDDENPEVAVLAFDTTVTYSKLQTLCRFVAGGVFYIATHGDLNCPHPVSPMPDVGSFIELVYAATGRRPDIICGKPYRPAADGVTQKYGIAKDRVVMVGDRLYTDIRFGNNFGFCTALVLTGETNRDLLAKSSDKPDLVFDGVKELTAALLSKTDEGLSKKTRIN